MRKTKPRKTEAAGRTRLLYKRWHKVVGGLACLVVFCTTYALILPAITLEGETYCGYKEHQHDKSCVEQILTCTLPEEGHTHTKDCYTTQEKLTCTKDEHTHSEDAGCYDSDGNLICTVDEHTHGSSCYTEEQKLTCNKSEKGHVHTEDCYKTTNKCGMEEHTHSLACYSNPNADVETAAAWEKTMSGVTLTGNYTQDIPAIANTQLGYTESSKNYQVAEDGATKLGYTRYGDWYGDPYGDWCAMFVSFCLNYAKVPANVFPQESSCDKWTATLTSRGLYQEAQGYTPKTGDIVFFDTDNDKIADNVGIVSELTNAELKSVEGDCDDSVKTNTYKLEDSTILGYGVMPLDKTQTAPAQATATKAPESEKTLVYNGDDYVVTVTYDKKANLPDNVELVAEEYAKDSENYRARYAEAAALYGWNEDHTAGIRLFNVSLYVDGKEVEPASPVQVKISYNTDKDAESIGITHFADAGTETVDDVTTTYENGVQTAEFALDGFSDIMTITASQDDTATQADDTDDTYTNAIGKAPKGGSRGDVNFYLAVVSENQDPEDTSTWTLSLHTEHMYTNTDASTLQTYLQSYGEFIVRGSNRAYGETAETNDETIRKNLQGPFDFTLNNNTYSLKISKFPDDQTILTAVRNQPKDITVAGKKYEPKEITADKFDIKWIVVKHNNTDGWHVDGILVRKNASLTVKKTFVGNADAINAVKEGNFNITVNGAGYSGKTLTLNDATTVSEDGNTYTWVVNDLTAGNDYTVTESDYSTSDNSKYLVSPSYAVTNSSSKDNDESGNGNTVTANAVRSYLKSDTSDTYQTVAFTNVYTEPYKLTIMKQDGTTKHPLKDVKFDLTVKDSSGNVKKNGTITSNEKGILDIDFNPDNSGLGVGEYTFTLNEKENPGYKALSTVTGNVKVETGGKVTVSNLRCDVSGDDTLVEVDGTNATIYIVNVSDKINVTVNKKWVVDNDNDKLPVTVQLMRNNAEVADKKAELNSNNNWTCTWDDLPYYVDGKPAHYTVRETWIGKEGVQNSVSYNDSVDSDGYADYIVTQSTSTSTDGKTITVNLTNRPDKGQVVVTKLDKETNAPLAGAEFTVYTDAACTEKVAPGITFSSDANGEIVISNSNLVEGTYYLKETTAPAQYKLSDEVYKLTVKDTNSTLETLGGKKVTVIYNNKVPPVNITARKVAAGTDNPKITLSGAQFLLYKQDGSDTKYYKYDANAEQKVTWESEQSAATTLTSDSNNGTFSINSLEDGTYYLLETKAPDGYNTLSDPVTITVANGKVTTVLLNENSIKVTEGTDSTYSFDIPNSAGFELPATGGSGTAILYSLGVMLILASAVGYGCNLRHRREGRGE